MFVTFTQANGQSIKWMLQSTAYFFAKTPGELDYRDLSNPSTRASKEGNGLLRIKRMRHHAELNNEQ